MALRIAVSVKASVGALLFGVECPHVASAHLSRMRANWGEHLRLPCSKVTDFWVSQPPANVAVRILVPEDDSNLHALASAIT